VPRPDAPGAAERTRHGNALIVAGVALGLGADAAHRVRAAGPAALGTAPLPIAAWGFIVAFAPLLLVLEEARKWLVRRPRFSRALPMGAASDV
jgi:hypothetical protein